MSSMGGGQNLLIGSFEIIMRKINHLSKCRKGQVRFLMMLFQYQKKVTLKPQKVKTVCTKRSQILVVPSSSTSNPQPCATF